MKKLFILAAAILVSSAALAQNNAQKDAQAIEKKIERNEAAVADAKKSTNASVWLERAGLMIDAATVYTKSMIAELPVAQMLLPSALGDPKEIEDVKVAGVDMSKYIYEHFNMYVSPEGHIQYWEVTKELRPDAFADALSALKKAKELNAKDFAKSGRGVTIVDRLVTESSNIGRSLYTLGKTIPAAKLFQGAYEASELKGTIDSLSLYYAGICYFDGGEYQTALQDFEKLLSFGSQQNGMTLSYIAGCQEKLGDKEKAIETYEKAFGLYPESSNIMGGLINAYMSADKSPEKLIDLIKKAQSIDPKNISLYLVESQIWEKIGKRDKSLGAIDAALAIDPKNFEAHFNSAILNLMSSDEAVEKANKLDINDTKGYDALMEEVKAARLKAIDMLEKAYQINPTATTVIELLPSIYFICRDYDKSIQEKHDKFVAEHPQTK